MSVADAGSRPYSESWYRVATVRAALRPSVRAHRQMFRGAEWVILHDPLNNHFFRVTEDAYGFLCRLSPDRTVDEVWREMSAADPDEVLSQEEVVQLLGHLYLSNLLHFDQPSASASIFERYRRRRQREARARLMGFLAIRIPLFDPDRLLERSLPFLRLLFGSPGLLCYLLLLALGAKVVIDNGDRLFDQAENVLAPDNLVLLYLGFLIAKVVHEFSHAAACKRFGGEVHVIGVMLLIMAPMPYVDASASWGFRSRGQRILVGAAGVLAEFALAAVAAVIWAYSAPGAIHSLAYNVMFVASATTLLFNVNPLLRFDGYYMLVDFIDMPNLYQRAREQLRFLGERYLFNVKTVRSAAGTPGESIVLPLFGAASLAYWAMLMSTIVFFVAEQYLDLGLLLAAVLVFMFAVWPLLKFLRYLATGPRLARHRWRAWGVTTALAGGLAGGLALIPVPDRIRATGIVEAATFRHLNSESAGYLAEVLAPPGSRVVAGQPLARLENAELDLEIRIAEAQRAQLIAQELRAETTMIADLAPLRRHREAIEGTIADLKRRRGALLVLAPIGGLWTAPEIESSRGRWITRGTSLGLIVDDRAFRFAAVLPQTATYLFDDEIRRVEVRLVGEEGKNIVGANARVIPFEHGQLPSPALGWAGGGEIAIASHDPRGLTAAEPFFLIHAAVNDATGEGARILHGRLGLMRITLDDRPLLLQWRRDLQQFLQKRFRT